MEELEKVKNSQFGTVICDYYGNGKGEFFMTRQQIGQALEYENPQKAIDNIHALFIAPKAYTKSVVGADNQRQMNFTTMYMTSWRV